MPDEHKMNEAIFNQLLAKTDDELLEDLGKQARGSLDHEPMVAGYKPYFQVVLGAADDAGDSKELGRSIFDHWNRELYKILCGDAEEDKSDRQELLDAIGGTEAALILGISGLLIKAFAVVPAAAAIIATIFVKRFAAPTGKLICQNWEKRLARE